MAKYTKYNTGKSKVKGSKKRTILLVIAGLVLVAGLLFILDRKGVINLPFSNDDEPAVTPDGINYDPPTEQEKSETEEFKKSLGDQSTTTNPTTPSGTKKSVTPVIVYSGTTSANAEVTGYVSGVVEEGGTCTVTLTKDGQKVTESKTATADATNTSCGLITIARTRLSPGTWSATLAYSSNTAEGTSTSKSIEVK